MSDEPSRVEEYIGHAASLRQMADNTQNPEMRKRLLGLADLFEVGKRAVFEDSPLARRSLRRMGR
jgi:hypothetical protein